jgi:hypothetical protein
VKGKIILIRICSFTSSRLVGGGRAGLDRRGLLPDLRLPLLDGLGERDELLGLLHPRGAQLGLAFLRELQQILRGLEEVVLGLLELAHAEPGDPLGLVLFERLQQKGLRHG